MHKIEVLLRAGCVGGVSDALRKARIGPFRVGAGARHAIGCERVKLELVVPDAQVEPVVEAIREGIDAFGEGDAELVVLAVPNSVRLSSLP